MTLSAHQSLEAITLATPHLDTLGGKCIVIPETDTETLNADTFILVRDTGKGIVAETMRQAYLDVQMGQVAPKDDGSNPIVLSYMYRDASNYKTSTAYSIEGPYTREDIALLALAAFEGEGFIPYQIGMRDIQTDLSDIGDDDHVWHEAYITTKKTGPKTEGSVTWDELRPLLIERIKNGYDLQEAVERVGISY